MGSVGSVEAMGKSNREIFAHSGSPRIETIEHNGLNVDSFLSFACRLASQFSLVRQISRIEKTQTWHDPHPSNQRDSFEKKKKRGGREKRWASNAGNRNRNSTRIVILLFLSSSSFIFFRIEITSCRSFKHFPSPFRIFHVAGSLKP